MLEWHQKLMTFEQSILDSITSLIDPTKTMLVPIESLGDDLQGRMFKNECRVAKCAVSLYSIGIGW